MNKDKPIYPNQMTNEEAKDILIQYNAYRRGEVNSPMPNPTEAGQAIDVAIRALSDKWVSVDERLPEVTGRNGSDRVFVMHIVGGRAVMGIMAYAFIEEGDGGYAWCNCYNQIDGDPDFDDNYDVTHWQPLPSPPTEKP